MKPKLLPRTIQGPKSIWLGCATAICLLGFASAQESSSASATGSPASAEPAAAAAADEAATDAVADPELWINDEFSNWINFTYGGTAVFGDEASFQRRTGLDADVYGGIDSMRYERIMDDVTLLFEGHALFGIDDYDLTLSLIKDDVGFLRAGFRHFRTYYDGSGGWVPRARGAWIPIVNDELAVDRGNLWIEAGLRMENVPEITLSYSHQWRDGVKDSLSWAPAALAPIGYGIVPTLNHINEIRDTIKLDVAHTVGNTDLQLGLFYEAVRNDNERQAHRAPRDATVANDRRVYHREIYDADLFNAHLSSESRLNDQMLLSFGYAFTTMNTDTSGSERHSLDRAGAWRSYSDHGNSPLTGGADHHSHVTNANFWWNPIPDLVIVPSIRAEWEDQSAVSWFTEWDRVTRAPIREYFRNDSDVDNLTEQLDIRFTGIDNLVLYTRTEYSQSDRDRLLIDIDNERRESTSRVSQQKYIVGANWYPIRGISLAAQYYRRNYDLDYDHDFAPVVGNAFDAQMFSHDFDIDDFNVRLTWRVLPTLTLASRYDLQTTEIYNRGRAGTGRTLDNVQSAEIERNVFSQSITWSPVANAYLQGSISLVNAHTNTPANNWAPRRITDFSNDYVTANLAAGYAFNPRTNIAANYTFYHSNNYPDMMGRGAAPSRYYPGSIPFGSDADEHALTVTLNRQVNDNLIWSLGYGFFASNDGAVGGHNNFTAHSFSTSFKIRF